MQSNNFETILNECALYVWEWDVPSHNVRFGVPSLEGLWIDDQKKLFKLVTVLERVHPDDIAKIFVSRNSPVYKSDEMFQIDLRLRLGNVGYEWFCIRGKVISRDHRGRPTHVHGVAINADQRYRAVMRLIESKNRQTRQIDLHNEYFVDMMQEMETFMVSLARSADTLIMAGRRDSQGDLLGLLDKLKGQAEHVMNFIDKFRSWTGHNKGAEDKDIRTLHLWEHLAELQQVYSLNKKGALHLQLINGYDDLKIYVNVKVLNLLLENVVNAQIHNSRNGELTLEYRLKDKHTLQLSVNCDNANPLVNLGNGSTHSEESLSLGVCRLLASRIHATVDIEQTQEGVIRYVINIPLGHRPTGSEQSTKLAALDETTVEKSAASPGKHAPRHSNSPQVQVLMGLPESTDLFDGRNLFGVTIATSTDRLLQQFQANRPSIIFIDDELTGQITVDQLLTTISPVLPVIVVSRRVDRANRHRVEQFGVRYMLTAPLTLRKVNLMIKKYLNF